MEKNKDNFSLHVIIPANTTATVYLPSLLTSKLFESGKEINKKDFHFSNNTITININSGEYFFEVK